MALASALTDVAGDCLLSLRLPRRMAPGPACRSGTSCERSVPTTGKRASGRTGAGRRARSGSSLFRRAGRVSDPGTSIPIRDTRCSGPAWRRTTKPNSVFAAMPMFSEEGADSCTARRDRVVRNPSARSRPDPGIAANSCARMRSFPCVLRGRSVTLHPLHAPANTRAAPVLLCTLIAEGGEGHAFISMCRAGRDLHRANPRHQSLRRLSSRFDQSHADDLGSVPLRR